MMLKAPTISPVRRTGILDNAGERLKGLDSHTLQYAVGILYLSVFFSAELSSLVALFIIVYGYYKLIGEKKLYPVLVFALSSRIVNGFALGVERYTFVTILTSYLPVVVFILLRLKEGDKNTIRQYGLLYLYAAFMLLSFLVNLSTAIPLFTKGLFPLISFVFCIPMIKKEEIASEAESLLSLLRVIFVTSLIVYVLPEGASRVDALLRTGKPFGVPSEINASYFQFGMLRNSGVFFDPRILGTFAYFFTYLSLRYYGEARVFDLLLAVLVSVSTLSRGPMVVLALVCLGYALHRAKRNVIPLLLVLLSGFCALACIAILSDNDWLVGFVSTFDLGNEHNALTQRSIFSDYSIQAFFQSPLIGNGYGYLTAPDTIQRVIYVDAQVTYSVVTDAYLFSLLGEVGIVGWLLFAGSLIQLMCKKRDALSFFLLIGIAFHLTGTDLPNMYMMYFGMLIMMYLANQLQAPEEST